MRQKRKLDHLNLTRFAEDGPGSSGFEDVHFIHNCLPELDFTEVSTATTFLGRGFEVPLMINAMTGGTAESEKLNAVLARVARRMGIPMAVGSQTAALENDSLRHSYSVAREENPDGFILANISAGAPVDYCRKAVEMIGADALQLHLNAPQEALMPQEENEPVFKGFLANIMAMVKASPVPVIVKEVGFGIAREEAERLLKTGVAALDIGGRGGTNFIRIEGLRGYGQVPRPFLKWGLPAVVTLVEVAEKVLPELEIVAAGGIRSGLDVARALALGATMTGIAGPLIRCYYKGGETAVHGYLLYFKQQLKQAMFMLGTATPDQLRRRPLVVLGEAGKWLELRGIELSYLARRGLEA